MELRICIDVDDMARATAFYTEGLGLKVGRRLDSEWVEIIGVGSAIDLLFNAAGTRPVKSQKTVRAHILLDLKTDST